MPEPTSRRTEGPTPAGGAYAIAYFAYDGQPVSHRFANQVTIVEYAADGAVLNTTFGGTTPTESLPTAAPFPEFDEARPDLAGAAAAAAQLGAGLGRWRLTPRRRSIEDGPAWSTQAVCLARSRVAQAPEWSDAATAQTAAIAVLENRPMAGRWVDVDVGGLRYFLQMSSTGAARQAMVLPDGVDPSTVVYFDASAHLAYDEQRLREVVSRLEGSTEDPADRAEALRLARNALGASQLAQNVWEELLRAAHAFVDYFAHRDPATIPVATCLETLNGLRTDALAARAELGLDALSTAAADLIAELGKALAAIDDAHLRWYYHQLAKSLASVPEPETRNLHRVASLMVGLTAAQGLRNVTAEIAQRAEAAASELIAHALDLDDLDGFYWLLYESVVPLQVAEIVHRALATMDPPVPGADRMVNMLEEKRVRVVASLAIDADQMYTPHLAAWYRVVQAAIETDGAAGARREIFELSGHTLYLPTKFAATLKQPGLDIEQLWKATTAARAPLQSLYAPTHRGEEPEHG